MINLALGVVLAAQPQGNEMRLMRFPDIHGDTIVFTYAADLWTASTQGGLARRITSHPGQEGRPKISPDGQWVAFTGEYDGNPDIYVVGIDGGEPKRLTFEGGADFVIDWTPDGKIAYKSSYGNTFVARLWMIDPQGGLPTRTNVEEIGDGSFSPDGKTLAYNRSTAHQFNWRRYRGGTQGKISFFDLGTNKYSEISAKRENSWFPMWVGENVYFVSDRNQHTVNLYQYNSRSKDLRQVTSFGDADIKWPSTDGKKIVYERDGYLYTYDIASNKIDKLSPRVLSDNVAARPMIRNIGSTIDGVALSPSGVRLALTARGELFSLPARTGETRNMSNSPGSREKYPAWSPDGKNIAYFSDTSGEMQLYIQPQMGGEAKQLTNVPSLSPMDLSYSPDGKWLSFPTRSYDVYIINVETKELKRIREPRYSGNTNHDWSPDSKWIAYIDGTKNFQDCIWLYEVATGKKTQITDGFYSDTSVAFDQGGKYLFFTSNRTFAPTFGTFEFSLKVSDTTRLYAMPLQVGSENPFLNPGDEEVTEKPAGGPPKPESKDIKIDMEGLAARATVLPMPPSNYGLVAGIQNGFLYFGGNGLQMYNVGAPGPATIMEGLQGLSLNASRTKMAYFAGGQIGITAIAPGQQPGAGRVNTAQMTTTWSPREEWSQIYWEAWRHYRDNFYDKDMLGLNWKAIGDRYAKYLPYVSHRADLSYVLGLLIGESGTGHSYVQGGESIISATPVNTGHLGVDYEASGNFIRMRKIYRGRNYEESSRGPLAEAGLNVNDGDYLLAIDGSPVSPRVNPHSLLLGKAGRTVVLTINSKPSTDGSRKIRVRPIASEQGLRYAEWVETNRKIVDKLSGGRIGYMHIPNTAFEGSVELVRGFYSQVDKDAVLVDERFNGGGYIQPWYVDTLARKVKAWIQQRHFADVPEAVAMEGPMCLLINGYAGSGGDFFPWMFKQAGRGPLIGTRTWGGLVGISGGAPLVDGGSITAPEFGIYDHKQGKFIAENTGVDPDIEVDARPDLLAIGRDPQLEKGVDYLLNELKKFKKEIKRPAFIRAPKPPR